MNRFDPLNPTAAPPHPAMAESAKAPARKTRNAFRVSSAPPAAAAGKVTLSETVRLIPLATFACLLCVDAETAKVKRDEFIAYCKANPQFTDWRAAWRAFGTVPVPQFTPDAPLRVAPPPQKNTSMEKLITRVEVTNPTPYKTRDLRGACFAVDAVYHIEGGATHAIRITTQRKKDLPDAIKRQIENAASGAMKASYHGEEYWGTCTSYTIGARGLEAINRAAEKEAEKPRPADTDAAVETALATLQPFIGKVQLACVRDGLRGEERQFFAEKMLELASIVDGMPKTYEQEGKGDDATVYLHYFAGGAANWWITEKDADPADEHGHHEGQVQAFGLANLFGGPREPDAELGYISIAEILSNGGELDFHFTPRTLRTLKAPPKPYNPDGITPPEGEPAATFTVLPPPPPQTAAEAAASFIDSL